MSGRRIAMSAIIVLTLLSGVVHGYLDGRWSGNMDLQQHAQSLDALPTSFGDWELIDESQLDANAAKLLRCHGSIVRLYKNTKSGVLVNVAVLFGPRGPIAVHTPEICYSSIGTDQVGQRVAHSVGSGANKDKFWAVKFSQDPLPDPALDVWYAWSDGGPWEAREQPRLWLTDNLYKIQAAGPVGDDDHRPVKDFLDAFTPLTRAAIK